MSNKKFTLQAIIIAAVISAVVAAGVTYIFATQFPYEKGTVFGTESKQQPPTPVIDISDEDLSTTEEPTDGNTSGAIPPTTYTMFYQVDVPRVTDEPGRPKVIYGDFAIRSKTLKLRGKPDFRKVGTVYITEEDLQFTDGWTGLVWFQKEE